MGRILAIDYGTKRTGIAATDPLQIIANGIGTFPTDEVFAFLKKYLSEEPVDCIVVGDPKYPDGNPAQIAHLVLGFARKLKEMFPEIQVALHDERYTSEDAKQIIRQSGAGKKKRQDKGLVDKVSAVLILQDYMERLR
ncbi:MAG: putative pre-16S rRNA nuclease [Haliscomenobacter sp.]|jgi:putative Holliday junction resolvase|nr:putative pre-16S rRNA nuclease [Haliscomenobacter sp.]